MSRRWTGRKSARALALGLDKARLAESYDTISHIHQPLENFIPPLLPGFFPRSGGPARTPRRPSSSSTVSWPGARPAG